MSNLFDLKNKKVLFGMIGVVVLLIGAIIGGVMFLFKEKPVDLKEVSFDNLIKVEYQVINKEFSKNDVKLVIGSTKLKDEDMKDLTDKVQALTHKNVELFFFDNKEKRDVPKEFYVDGLKNKTIATEKHLEFLVFNSIPTVDKNMNATKDWKISKADMKDGLLYVNTSIKGNKKQEDIVAQLKGLQDMVQKLNADKNVKDVEFTVNAGISNTYKYNTKFSTVLATATQYNYKTEK
ncbi:MULTISPECIES: hypothetical protein [Bacillus]|uniref:Uncharacterized protein n=2 Tax=Bacillus thuringiensis TaxID=1428 RepID=A0AAP4V281_BACTU|nr:MULTISPECIES: hypothetical protein [Bacillus]MEC0046480.1 hypothetical protein [Bacillus cereus]AFV21846.1 hypothetical protein BTB_502p05410 [Bacillus thuringiensis Bt407]EEM25129.1 hypothetical protein bthur0002_57710 [Bacillus thuringiensis Bt407]ERI00977.1 hypothetical protein BTCBT_002532 [Bacillus thuringiensis T01-328]MBN6707741.1 hypothetical protein [Bacillus thuringiensis]